MNNKVTTAREKSEASQLKFARVASVFFHVFGKEITRAIEEYDASLNMTLGSDALKNVTDAHELMKKAGVEFVALYRAAEALENTQIESKVQ